MQSCLVFPIFVLLGLVALSFVIRASVLLSATMVCSPAKSNVSTNFASTDSQNSDGSPSSSPMVTLERPGQRRRKRATSPASSGSPISPIACTN